MSSSRVHDERQEKDCKRCFCSSVSAMQICYIVFQSKLHIFCLLPENSCSSELFFLLLSSNITYLMEARGEIPPSGNETLLEVCYRSF